MSVDVLVVPKASTSAFVQTATATNTIGAWTFIDSSLTNGKPIAKIQITQNWNPGGKGGVYNPHGWRLVHIDAREWAIFNEDGTTIPTGAAFNVLVGQSASNGGKAQVLKTATSNRTKTHAVFSSAGTTGNPNNFILVTQNWDPDGNGGVYNNSEVGVEYNGSQEAVLNESGQTIPLSAAFNLLIFSN